MYDVIIPSCKSYEDVNILASLIKQYDPDGNKYNYIPTGFSTSASVNRITVYCNHSKRIMRLS